jgi:hypothetical protein
MFANAIRPGHQVENIGGLVELKQPMTLFLGDRAAVQNSLSEFTNLVLIGCVN